MRDLTTSVPLPRAWFTRRTHLDSKESLASRILDGDHRRHPPGIGRRGIGRPGAGTLKVDGKEVQTITLPHTLPMILQWDESFDIGSDTLTGVNDADYQPPFPLTAQLNKLAIKVDRPQLSPEDIKKLEEGMAKAADAK